MNCKTAFNLLIRTYVTQDLVKRLLEPFDRDDGDLRPSDEKLSEAYKELSGLPRNLFSLLEEEPEDFEQCPLNEKAPEDVRIHFAQVLDSRIKDSQLVQGSREPSPMPEIRLEINQDDTPGISVTSFDSSNPEGSLMPKTLLASRTSVFGNAHPKHCSVLLRLLYLHNVINPGNSSSHTASLLVPLYSAMLQEVEVEHLTHVEADTFWVLEAMVAEVCELDEDGGKLWIEKLHERLAVVDADLLEDLVRSLLYVESNPDTVLDFRNLVGSIPPCHIIPSNICLRLHCRIS